MRGISVPVLPKRVNERWLVIILVDGRITNVAGPVIFVIVSIQTIKY